MSRSYVLNAFIETPWAILPSKLVLLEEIMIRHVSGEKLDAAEIQARIQGTAPRPQDRKVNNVAVLPLFGTIIPRADMFEEASGATSAEKFGKNFAKLLADPNIDAIVLDVDSPGGQVGGIPELSQQIYDARGTKPVIAVANQLMASAAYWIGTAADELVVTPSGEVGSVGVFSVHNDMSAALEKNGLKLSLISAGKYKVEGNPYQPLTEEARASIQAKVDDVYDVFVNTIARNRGVSADAVRNGFGEGRVVSANKAVEMGMADRVATLDEVINGLFNTNATPAQTRASDTGNPVQAGQVPEPLEQTAMQEARARLELAANKKFEGDSPMLRELQKQRADLLARANELVATADAENRDLTEAERKEFQEIMGVGESQGKLGALDAQIETIQGEREQLRKAAEKKFVTPQAVKPEDSTADAKVMKRDDYNKLTPEDRLAFSKAGGKLTD